MITAKQFLRPHRRCLSAAMVFPLMCAAPVHAEPAQPPGLVDVVEYTLQTNPEVLADVHGRRAADHVVEQAEAGYRPRVNLEVGHGNEKTSSTSTGTVVNSLGRREASLTATQALFDGFGTSARVKASEARVNAAALGVATTSVRVGLRAIEVYLEFMRRKTLSDYAKENLQLHESIYDQIKIRARQGVTTNVNLEQIEGRKALSESDLVASESRIDEAGYRFQRVVGYLPYELAPPPSLDCKIFPATVEQALQTAAAVHPALEGARADVRAAYEDEEAAYSALYPELNLELSASRNNDIDGVDGINHDDLVMLRAAFNVYNGGRDSARIKELKHRTDQAIEIYNSLLREIEEATRLAWNAFEALEKRSPPLERRMETAMATREAYAKQFNIGQRTLLDLLDIGREEFTARSEFAEVEYDRMFTSYRLLAAMGVLLETIGVEPPEEAKLGRGGYHPRDPHVFSRYFDCRDA